MSNLKDFVEAAGGSFDEEECEGGILASLKKTPIKEEHLVLVIGVNEHGVGLVTTDYEKWSERTSKSVYVALVTFLDELQAAIDSGTGTLN